MLHKEFFIKEGEIDEKGIFIFKGRTSLEYNKNIVRKKVKKEVEELEKIKENLNNKGESIEKVSRKIQEAKNKNISKDEFLLAEILCSKVTKGNIVKNKKENNDEKANNSLAELMVSTYRKTVLDDLVNDLVKKGVVIEDNPRERVTEILNRLRDFSIIDYSLQEDGELNFIQVSPFIAWYNDDVFGESRQKIITEIERRRGKHIFSKYPINTDKSILRYLDKKPWIVNYYFDKVFDEFFVNGRVEKYGTKVVLSHDNSVSLTNKEGDFEKSVSNIYINYLQFHIVNKDYTISWVGEKGFSQPLYEKIKYLFPQSGRESENKEKSLNIESFIKREAEKVFLDKKSSFKKLTVRRKFYE